MSFPRIRGGSFSIFWVTCSKGWVQHVPCTCDLSHMPTSCLLDWPAPTSICTPPGAQDPSHVNVHPFPSSDKPCELYCSPLGKESPLLVADRVLDGTPCGPYETDLCVHGRCQVMCFPCVLGRVLKGRLPPGGAWGGRGLRGLGEWTFSRRHPAGGVASCSLAPLPPSAVTEPTKS